MTWLLIGLLAVFFTINMGGASFAASFGAPYGGRIISRWRAALLFVFFVTLGAVFLGHNVTHTLEEGIIPSKWIDHRVVIVIFLSAGLSMFSANLMKIPQTTSIVTVASIAGVGWYLGELQTRTIWLLIPFWIILPLLSFGLTHLIAGYAYPPRKINFWIYEKIVHHRRRLEAFVIITSCYNAFSVGSNNVANVVGPLGGLSEIPMLILLGGLGVIYGLGGFLFPGTLKTAGDQIVPLGLLTASIISFVSGSLMIFASVIGIPQSFVMLQMGSVFAIASLKNGKELTFQDPLTKKTLYTWTFNPVLTVLISYFLARLVFQWF